MGSLPPTYTVPCCHTFGGQTGRLLPLDEELLDELELVLELLELLLELEDELELLEELLELEELVELELLEDELLLEISHTPTSFQAYSHAQPDPGRYGPSSEHQPPTRHS